MSEKRVQISTEDVSDIINSIIYNDVDGFGEILERGFDVLEEFSEKLREQNGTFVVTTWEDE